MVSREDSRVIPQYEAVLVSGLLERCHIHFG
jgi:hypothetical protein